MRRTVKDYKLMMKIALGSARAAKIEAVRASCARIAALAPEWREAEVIARPVSSDVPAMPLTDEELMKGARTRALAVRELLRSEGTSARLYVGLEGGFHSMALEGRWMTFLRGWAYATDDEGHDCFGASPSILIPDAIARRVLEGGGAIELGPVMDELAGERDVRSRQGAWGVLSRDLLTRSMSFEAALIAAFAPFYNSAFYI